MEIPALQFIMYPTKPMETYSRPSQLFVWFEILSILYNLHFLPAYNYTTCIPA